MLDIKKIKDEIEAAASQKNKTVMFHLSVLVNAGELSGLDARAFCRDVGMPDSFAVEFRKMKKLGDFMKQKGLKIG